ncbi:MAG: exopolysaccharide biosynthesis protein [Spongiibacter sp.]|nr:exopolysaccharide biosynthesis protein [Spongiibacter sp.]
MEADSGSLSELIDGLQSSVKRRERVSVGVVVDAVGRRSFGPLLLIVGLVILSPLSGVPGVPTLLALLVILVALQLLLGRRQVYIPAWLMRRSLDQRIVVKVLSGLRGPAERVDRVMQPRLSRLTNRTGSVVIALVCLLISISMPLMELLPFSATAAGLVLTMFGLALVFRDGLVALVALTLYMVVAGGIWLGL